MLGRLPAIAFALIREVYQESLGRADVVPGMVATVQTFGELAHWHPHVHAIVTDGVFASDGRFAALPQLAVEPFLKLWEHRVFKLLLDEGRISPETVEQMRSWQHSGFSVDRSVFVRAGDGAALERLVQYIARCPFSLDRILKLTPTGHVVYKAEHDGCRRFPEPASGTLRNGVSRNFQVFDPLDFLAEVTQHPASSAGLADYAVASIPPRVACCAVASMRRRILANKSRGMRAKAARGDPAAAPAEDLGEADALFRKTCRSRWAAMIKKVYEVDPLECPRCGGQMRIVAFVEARTQADIIEQILRHCGLWVEPLPRAPPKFALAVDLDPEYIPIDEFLANF